MAKKDYTQAEIAIAETYRPLVRAAGLDSSSYDAGHLYRLGSEIIHDSEVQRRAFTKAVGCVGPSGAGIEVLNEMTDAEKTELAQRIAKKAGQTLQPVGQQRVQVLG